MGNRSSSAATNRPPAPMQTEGVERFELRHPGTCSGMFWRKDPRPDQLKCKQKGNKDWPRNGSILEGMVHELPDMKWLQVVQWKQAGSSTWITGCEGLWMQFEQGGLLLHKQ